MPRASEIAECKERYSAYSDEQLIAEKHQWVENSEMHIAAVQILHERQAAAQSTALDQSRQQHIEALSHSSRLHGKTQFIAWLAFVAAVAGILVPLWLAHSSAKSSLPSASIVQQAPTASQLPSSSSLPQEAKPQSVKQPVARPKP